MNIIMIPTSDVCYSSLEYFSDCLGNAFKTNGHTVHCVETFTEAIEKSKFCDFAIGFNCELNMRMPDGRLFFAELNIPVVDFLVDHPMLHDKFFRVGIKNVFLVCLDQNHVNYAKRYYDIVDAIQCYVLATRDATTTFSKREREVTFIGSYTDEMMVLNEINQFDGTMKMIAIESIQYLLAYPDTPIEEAMLTVLENKGIVLSNDDFAILMSSVGTKIDFFLRGYFRHQLVEKLTNGGIEIHCFGNDWDKLKISNRSKVILHNSVSFYDSALVMGTSKMVLNVTPWFKRGIHDRVISTMLCGSISVTDETELSKTLFEDGKDYISYGLKEMDILPEKIYGVFDDDNYLEFIAENGRTRAQDNFSWDDVSKK